MNLNKFQLFESLSIETLDKRSRVLALMDAILIDEWELRYFSYNARWDQALGESMASYRNGEGEEYFILFCKNRNSLIGTFSDATDYCIGDSYIENVPEGFSSFLTEPAFNVVQSNFLFWKVNQNTAMKYFGNRTSFIESRCFSCLIDFPNGYLNHIENYCEIKIDISLFEAIQEEMEFSEELIIQINPAANLKRLEEDFSEILG